MVSLVDLYRGNQVVSPTLRHAAMQGAAPVDEESEDPWYLSMLNTETSAFGSFLDWFDRPGQAVRNVLRGDIGAAGRHLVDFAGKVPTAFIPGVNWSNQARPEDHVSGSQLVGMSSDAPWYASLPVDIGLGVATDPLSLLTFGGSGAAGSVARSAGRAATQARSTALGAATAAAKHGGTDGMTRFVDETIESVRSAARRAASGETGAAAPAQFTNEVDALAALYSARTGALGEKAVEARLLREAAQSPQRAPQAPTAAGRAEQIRELRLAQQRQESLRTRAQGSPERIKSINDEIGSIREQMGQITKDIAQASRNEYMGVREAAAVRSAIPESLQYNLKASARRELAKQGPNAIEEFTDRVAREIGSNFDRGHVKSVLSKYKGQFDQGGLRLLNMFGGHRIKAADTAYDMVRQGFGRAADALPPAGKEYLEVVGNWGARLGLGIRKTMGSNWLTLGPTTRGMRDRAKAAGGASSSHALREVGRTFNGMDNATNRAFADVFDNIRYGEDGSPLGLIAPRQLDETGRQVRVTADDLAERVQAMREMPEYQGVDFDRLTQAVRKWDGANVGMWDELKQFGSVNKQIPLRREDGTVEMLDNMGRDSMLTRRYSGKVYDADGRVIRDFGEKFDSIDAEIAGIPTSIGGAVTGDPSTIARRTLDTDEELLAFLRENPGVRLDRNGFRRAMTRAEKQGIIVGRTQLARDILGDEFTHLADPQMRDALAQTVGQIAHHDKEMAAFLEAAMSGVRPRRGLFPLLAKANRLFKPAAVYAVALPRVAGLTKNLTGGMYGALSSIGVDQLTLQLKNLPGNVASSVAAYARHVAKHMPGQGKRLDRPGAVATAIGYFMGLSHRAGGKLADDIRFMQQLEGLPREEMLARAAERSPFMREALEEGILEGFITSEQLIRNHYRSPTARVAQAVADAPGAMYAHTEGSMRYATYKSLREQGMTRRVSAQLQRDAFIDYDIAFIENRTLRDLIPFAAFTAGTIAQQARFLPRNPYMLAGIAQLYGQQTDYPQMPWMRGTATIHMGKNAEGTPLVAAGMGLPFETLGIIPNLTSTPRKIGRDLRTGVMGSGHPLMKALYGYTTGQDPFFSGPYGSYDQTPYSLQALGFAERGEFSRLFREVSSTGLLQPLQSVMNTFDRLADPRMGAPEKALNLLTGMRIVANDPDRAAYRILQDRLSSDPRARQHIRYSGGSEEIDASLKALREASRRMRERREAKEAAELDP